MISAFGSAWLHAIQQPVDSNQRTSAWPTKSFVPQWIRRAVFAWVRWFVESVCRDSEHIPFHQLLCYWVGAISRAWVFLFIKMLFGGGSGNTKHGLNASLPLNDLLSFELARICATNSFAWHLRDGRIKCRLIWVVVYVHRLGERKEKHQFSCDAFGSARRSTMQISLPSDVRRLRPTVRSSSAKWKVFNWYLSTWACCPFDFQIVFATVVSLHSMCVSSALCPCAVQQRDRWYAGRVWPFKRLKFNWSLCASKWILVRIFILLFISGVWTEDSSDE